MSSLPNTLNRPKLVKRTPQTKKKIAGPELRTEPRMLAEIDREFRGPTGTRWAPIPASFDADRFRLASGGTFWALTSYLVHRMAAGRKQGDPLPLECEIDIAETAVLIRCNERSVNRELAYLQVRDMAIVARLAGGRAVVRLVLYPESHGDKEYPGWSAVSLSYQEWADSQRESLEEQAEEIAAESDNPADKLNTHVVLAPRKVVKGKRCRQKLEGFVRRMTVQCDSVSPVDIRLSGELRSGELVLSICGDLEKTSRSNPDSKRAVSTSSDKTSGRTRPNREKIPPNAGIKNTPTIAGIKRGKELAKLFDAPLFSSCQKTLTGDIDQLVLCSQIIGDVPPQFLSDAVAVRAGRAIKNPRHCAMICREIAANWKASQNLPAPARKLPSREEIQAMIAREKEERIRKQKALQKR